MSNPVIHNDTLIDGRCGSPVLNAALLIEDDRIVVVGVAKSLTLDQAIYEKIDAKGGFILPDLIDTHVDLALEDRDNSVVVMKVGDIVKDRGDEGQS